VEVEAVEVRVPGTVGDDPRGIRLLAQTPHAAAGAASHGDAPLDGAAADAGEGRRFFRDQIRRRDVGFGIETATPEEAPHPRGESIDGTKALLT
jgi:hypothetical protein